MRTLDSAAVGTLKLLKPEDAARYVATGKSLIDELEPRFFEYVERANIEFAEAAERRKLNADKLQVITLSSYSTGRTNGYSALVQELTAKLRAEMLRAE